MDRESIVVKKYFKDVSKHLSCAWNVRKGFINYIKEQLDEKILYDKTITREKLVELLGEPEKLAESFDSINQKEIRVRAKVCTLAMLLSVALIVIVVLLVLFIIYLIYSLNGTVSINA